MLFLRKKIAAAPPPSPPPPASMMVPLVKESIQLTDTQRVALAPLLASVPLPKSAETQTDELVAASEDRLPGRIIPFHIHQAERRAPEAGEGILRVAGGHGSGSHPIV